MYSRRDGLAVSALMFYNNWNRKVTEHLVHMHGLIIMIVLIIIIATTDSQ